jgi:hypothetical protein
MQGLSWACTRVEACAEARLSPPHVQGYHQCFVVRSRIHKLSPLRTNPMPPAYQDAPIHFGPAVLRVSAICRA